MVSNIIIESIRFNYGIINIHITREDYKKFYNYTDENITSGWNWLKKHIVLTCKYED